MKESHYTAGEDIQTAVTPFSTGFNSVLTNSRTWINGYGALQRLLGKHEAKQFEVVQDKNDYLYLQTAKQSESETEGAINDIIRIFKKTEEVGGNFLFVQCPYKNFTYEESLKGYGEDFTEYNNDEIVRGLEQADIPTLDLSLCFKETRYLDPQKGRFEDNYLEYIEEYTPDIVIVMYDAEINTGRL